MKDLDESKLSDETRIQVPGYDKFMYQPKNFHNMQTQDIMELSFYTGRRIREVLRNVLSKYGVEPDWKKAMTSSNPNERIYRPHIMTGSDRHEFPEDAAHRAMVRRVMNRFA